MKAVKCLFIILVLGVSAGMVQAVNILNPDFEGDGLAEIVYRDPNGLFAAFDVNLIGDQFAENANTVLVDSYTLANLRLGYEFMTDSLQISPFLGITNLSDENYFGDVRINAEFGQRYFDPAPGRSAYAGVTVRFGR